MHLCNLPEPQRQMFNAIQETHKQLTDMRLEYWIKYELFEPQWWFLLLLLVVPWLVWYKLVDKGRIKDILLYGVFVALVATYLDAIGNELVLWSYPHSLMPLMPKLFPVDLSLLPVIFMLIYQYFPQWKPFIIVSILTSLFSAVVAEPMFVYLGIYEMYKWEYWYSFVIYIVLSFSFKWINQKLDLRV